MATRTFDYAPKLIILSSIIRNTSEKSEQKYPDGSSGKKINKQIEGWTWKHNSSTFVNASTVSDRLRREWHRPRSVSIQRPSVLHCGQVVMASPAVLWRHLGEPAGSTEHIYNTCTLLTRMCSRVKTQRLYFSILQNDTTQYIIIQFYRWIIWSWPPMKQKLIYSWRPFGGKNNIIIIYFV